jgi:hypothetical protein
MKLVDPLIGNHLIAEGDQFREKVFVVSGQPVSAWSAIGKLTSGLLCDEFLTPLRYYK